MLRRLRPTTSPQGRQCPKNIKIIQLSRHSPILLKKALILLKESGGAGTLQFLIEHFSFLGFEGQYWMLIGVGVIAVFICFVRINRNRI
jgi:hypothetical protein